MKNARLEARLKTLLPAEMTVADARNGFKNWGQFVAAVQVSNNRVSASGDFGQSYASAGTHQTTSPGIGLAVGLTATHSLYAGLGRKFHATEVGPGGLSLAGGCRYYCPNQKLPKSTKFR